MKKCRDCRDQLKRPYVSYRTEATRRVRGGKDQVRTLQRWNYCEECAQGRGLI